MRFQLTPKQKNIKQCEQLKYYHKTLNKLTKIILK